MKKITLLFLTLLMVSFGYAQEVVQSFEASGAIGEVFGGAGIAIITDTGTNTTQVLEVIGNAGKKVWQGLNVNLAKNVELTTSKTMTIDVFSATPITFLVKVNAGVDGADITGKSSGDMLSYGVKFAWAAGGFGVTKYFPYTVGDDCELIILTLQD
tara:strand:+ start:42594 stop:43061 length:468 start_codon:yes stop_codon:yes gene_type:complete